MRAFWRNAPGVRFIALAIFPIGVFAFECFRSSARSDFVHATSFLAFAFFDVAAFVALAVVLRFVAATLLVDLAFVFFAITGLHYKELRYGVQDTKGLTSPPLAGPRPALWSNLIGTFWNHPYGPTIPWIVSSATSRRLAHLQREAFLLSDSETRFGQAAGFGL
jgi:hypothetical protein